MDFSKTLKSVEDAVYEVMIWVLLLPKTFWLALARPRRAIEYVAEEWKKKSEERFDEYLSPVLLWLMMTVVPFSLILVFSGDIKEGESVLSKAVSSENFLKAALYMMIVPFVYIASIEMKNKQPVKRSTLKQAFYKHCYALTPGLLLTALFTFSAFFIPIIGLLLGVLALIVLPFYEGFVFQSELNAELTNGESEITYRKGFLYALVPQVILLLVMFVGLGFAFS
jgi:hypothetical protein